MSIKSIFASVNKSLAKIIYIKTSGINIEILVPTGKNRLTGKTNDYFHISKAFLFMCSREL